MTTINKLHRDGKVAILVSPGYGAGWFSWNIEVPEILFGPAIVQLVEEEKFDQLEVYVTLKYPEIYAGGLSDLTVNWLPEGTEFKVVEYDGHETLEFKQCPDWIVA